jgi:type III secretion protein W
MLRIKLSKSKLQQGFVTMIPIQTGMPSGQPMTGRPIGGQTPLLDNLRPDLASVLSDAAEELTQALSTKVQERKLKERMASGELRPNGLSRTQMAEMLETLAGEQKPGDEGSGRSPAERAIEEVGRKIRERPNLARQHAREQGGSASEQYLLLMEVAERLSEGRLGPDPGGRAAEAAREGAAELYAEYGKEIHADLNTYSAVRNLSGADAAQFRSEYREVVMGEATVADTLRRLVDMVPDGQHDRFDQVLDMMREALGLDLAAARPSGDPVRLQSLVTDLAHMKVIRTVIDQCAEISANLTRRHGLEPPVSATRMTRELLALTSDRWVDSSRVSRMADDLGATEPPEATVHLLTGARNALRELPVQVYSSADARQTLLDAAQSALDHAIDREEGFA